MAALALLGFLGKLVFEVIKSAPVFASNLGPGVSVATITHLAGFLALAILVGLRTIASPPLLRR